MTIKTPSQLRRSVHGILLLDKPIKMSSNGALQRVKRLFNAKKAGHTGSLDPHATGLLPICFGEATKFSGFLLDSDKSYEVTALLGVETSTGDTEGEVTSEKPVEDMTQDRLNAAMQKFLGDIEQTPPMYSALKHNGKPLYVLARQGIEIERKPRAVSIFSMDFLAYESHQLTFRVHCSKGTYIRTLVEDIGRHLGCGAHVIGLRRISVSPYGAATMHTLADLEKIAEQSGMTGLNQCLLPIETAVQVYPSIHLSTASAFYLRMGQFVRISNPTPNSLVRLFSETGQFLGVGEVLIDGRVKPHRLLSA